MREIVLGRVAIVPLSFLNRADRDVDTKRTEILVVYPDDTKGAELDDLVRAVRETSETGARPA